MKMLIAPMGLLMCLLMCSTQVLADAPSVHGMVLFGDQVLYASHMPMFHAPHDYQAIFQATLDVKGMTAYVTAKKDDADQMVTIVPEPFDLSEMIAKPRSFYADVYKGHFERGGVLVASHVKVSITKVVHAHKLGEAASNGGETFRFGERDWSASKKPETYEAHFIGGVPPDFDQIQQIDIGPRGEAAKTIYREDSDLSE